MFDLDLTSPTEEVITFCLHHLSSIFTEFHSKIITVRVTHLDNSCALIILISLHRRMQNDVKFPLELRRKYVKTENGNKSCADVVCGHP